MLLLSVYRYELSETYIGFKFNGRIAKYTVEFKILLDNC